MNYIFHIFIVAFAFESVLFVKTKVFFDTFRSEKNRWHIGLFIFRKFCIEINLAASLLACQFDVYFYDIQLKKYTLFNLDLFM